MRELGGIVDFYAMDPTAISMTERGAATARFLVRQHERRRRAALGPRRVSRHPRANTRLAGNPYFALITSPAGTALPRSRATSRTNFSRQISIES